MASVAGCGGKTAEDAAADPAAEPQPEGDEDPGGAEAPAGETLAVTAEPVVEVLSPTSARVAFSTSLPSTAEASWAAAGGESGALPAGAESASHELLLEGLPAKGYVGVTLTARRVGEEAFRGPVHFSTPSGKSSFSVLFDQAHAQAAGNAYWLVDDDAPDPSPASPSSANAWNGAYSSLGYELWKTGRYRIRSLPEGRRFACCGTADALDLSRFDAVVLPEPNSALTKEERGALVRFVADGGGIFLIANHAGSDRNSDGLDSVEVLNQLFSDNGVAAFPFAIRFYPTNISESPVDTLSARGDIPVLRGPFGEVAGFGLYNGSTITIVEGAGTARALAWMPGHAGKDDHIILAAGVHGAGRFVAVGDSSAACDGTDSGNDYDASKDGWKDFDNRELFMNAVAWLAGE